MACSTNMANSELLSWCTSSEMLPFQSHSDTSLQAAIDYAAKAPNARQRVHSLLERVSEGLTDEEIQGYLNMSANTERPRRIELYQEGLVIDSGVRRSTRSGADAVVWKVSGGVYPKKWPKSPSPSSESLGGDAKAIAEIKQAIPEKRRSPELKNLLYRLENENNPTYAVESGDDLEDDWRM